VEGQGIRVELPRNASHQTKTAAEALVAALQAVPLAVNGPSEMVDNPALDENMIVIDVLPHP
jgi:hypothetical protein